MGNRQELLAAENDSERIRLLHSLRQIQRRLIRGRKRTRKSTISAPEDCLYICCAAQVLNCVAVNGKPADYVSQQSAFRLAAEIQGLHRAAIQAFRTDEILRLS